MPGQPAAIGERPQRRRDLRRDQHHVGTGVEQRPAPAGSPPRRRRRRAPGGRRGRDPSGYGVHSGCPAYDSSTRSHGQRLGERVAITAGSRTADAASQSGAEPGERVAAPHRETGRRADRGPVRPRPAGPLAPDSGSARTSWPGRRRRVTPSIAASRAEQVLAIDRELGRDPRAPRPTARGDAQAIAAARAGVETGHSGWCAASRGDDLRRGQHVADPQAGQAPRLGEAADHHQTRQIAPARTATPARPGRCRRTPRRPRAAGRVGPDCAMASRRVQHRGRVGRDCRS